ASAAAGRTSSAPASPSCRRTARPFPRGRRCRFAVARSGCCAGPADSALGARRLLQDPQADLDDLGVELRPARADEATEGLVDRQRIAIGPVGGHRVEGVAGEDDARLERDLLALQAVRVAEA